MSVEPLAIFNQLTSIKIINETFNKLVKENKWLFL